MKEYLLKEIANVKNGYAFDSSKYSDKGIPIIRIADIKDNIDLSKCVCIDEEINKEFLIKKGSLLIALSGATTGKMSVFSDNKIAYLNQRICSIYTKNEYISQEFLIYFLKSIQKKIIVNSYGGAQPNISSKWIENIKIKVPNIEIQKKISKKLELLANSINSRKSQLVFLKELTKSLFTRIFGDIKSNDKNWKIYKFSEKLKISSGGTPSKANKIYWENGTISWIGSNMCNDEIITKNDGKFITEEGLKNSSAKIYKMNTVIVALVGATIGKTGLLKFETSTNQNIAALEIKNMDYSPEFLFFLLQNLYYKFTELGGDTFKMANLSFIKNLPLISPPIELQNKFAERIEKIEKLKFTIWKIISKVYKTLKKKGVESN